MTELSDAPGAAALAICKSLLRSLTELQIIGEEDVRGLLTDVATMHSEAALSSTTPEKDHAVAAIVKGMLAGRRLAFDTP